jgi:AraC-like DNA-binding protein
MDIYLDDCHARRTAARATEFAKQLGVTREHLTRTALEATGTSLRDLLRARQLQRAEKLLRATSHSAARIGAACGFGTRTTFYRAFRAAFGVTPGEYRRKVTK